MPRPAPFTRKCLDVTSSMCWSQKPVSHSVAAIWLQAASPPPPPPIPTLPHHHLHLLNLVTRPKILRHTRQHQHFTTSTFFNQPYSDMTHFKTLMIIYTITHYFCCCCCPLLPFHYIFHSLRAKKLFFKMPIHYYNFFHTTVLLLFQLKPELKFHKNLQSQGDQHPWILPHMFNI